MRFSAPALGVLLAACGGLEPEDTELEPDPTIEDPNAPDVGVGRSIAELVSFSCATHTDVGYVNGNPYPITLITVEGQPMELHSANALLTMAKAAEASGVFIRFSSPDSAFRTMARQQYYWGCYLNKNCNSGSPAARPGFSNHQSGHAVDLNTANARVYAWLTAHAATYGWKRTVASEKWHWEWWGGGNPTQYCGNCVCAAGQTQTQVCGDCGKQTRACNGCQWNGWGACGGPDPAGGSQVCDSGAKGVCAPSRIRCAAGTLACLPQVAPSAEVCDGLDNDCDGDVDDGNPAIGAVVPPFAATLTDVSFPRTLKRGERATIWAEFRNDGTTAWTRENLWLAARSPASPLAAPDAWPASNIAALLGHPVQPGETGRFSFEIAAGPDVHGTLNEIFTLQRSDGTVVACPAGEITAAIRIAPEPLAPVPAAAAPSRQFARSGCGCSSGGPGGFALVALAVPALRRRRQSQCIGSAPSSSSGASAADPTNCSTSRA